MKLFEITSKEKGSFIGWKFNKESISRIKEYMKDAKLEYPSKPSSLHVTVLYSEKHCPNLIPQGKFNTLIPLEIDKLEIFGGEEKVLVIRLKNKDITKRNKELMNKYNVISKYGEYKPHITIGYKIDKGFNINDLPDIKKIGRLFANEEYYQVLDNDLDYKAKSISKKKTYKK